MTDLDHLPRYVWCIQFLCGLYAVPLYVGKMVIGFAPNANGWEPSCRAVETMTIFLSNNDDHRYEFLEMIIFNFRSPPKQTGDSVVNWLGVSFKSENCSLASCSSALTKFTIFLIDSERAS